jgi:hypothetical protein
MNRRTLAWATATGLIALPLGANGQGGGLNLPPADWGTIASAVIALLALVVSIYSSHRSKQHDTEIRRISKAQASYDAEVRSLLGSKETVGFTAFTYVMDGLPGDSEDSSPRRNAIRALCAAAIFERSDRARALVFTALRDNYAQDKKEIDAFLSVFERSIGQLEKMHFTKEELDLTSATAHVSALKKLLKNGVG